MPQIRSLGSDNRLCKHAQEGLWGGLPWVTALYSTPSVALVPFVSLWMGIGETAKVAVLVLFAIFPMILNTQQGIRSTAPY